MNAELTVNAGRKHVNARFVTVALTK